MSLFIIGIRLLFCTLSTLSLLSLLVLLLGATLSSGSLKGAHALEALDQHPEREEDPRGVNTVQEQFLTFTNRKGKVLVLGQIEGGEDGEDSSDDMGRVDTEPKGD